MRYERFRDNVKLSKLGLGAMRLPQTEPGFAGPIDESKAREMIDYCMQHGVNYYDTAYIYHGGKSEAVLGRALRFVMNLPGVAVVLSGMSDMRQTEENIETAASGYGLADEELSKLEKISRVLRRKIAVPCTGCRYCCDNCPQGLDIPLLLAAYNDYRDEAAASGNSDMAIWRLLRLKALPEENILSLFPVLYYNGNREINTISGGDYAKENRYSQSTDHRIRPDHHRTGL